MPPFIRFSMPVMLLILAVNVAVDRALRLPPTEMQVAFTFIASAWAFAIAYQSRR